MIETYQDGENFLPIRTKINNALGCLQVAETDDAIAAGATRSIPISPPVGNLLNSGDKVQLIDITTGTMHELTLADELQNGDNYITISSYTFPDDLVSGCPIFIKMSHLLAKLYSI